MYNSLVLVNGNTIEFVGIQGQKDLPRDMEVLDTKGMTIIPGQEVKDNVIEGLCIDVMLYGILLMDLWWTSFSQQL